MVLAPIAAEPSPQGISADGGVTLPSLPAFIHAACFSSSCCLLNKFQEDPLSCSSKCLKHAGSVEKPRVIWHGEHVRGGVCSGQHPTRAWLPRAFRGQQGCACPSRAGRDAGELLSPCRRCRLEVPREGLPGPGCFLREPPCYAALVLQCVWFVM